MNELQIDPMSMFEPYMPNRNIWLLFKVGSIEHITAMQQGLLYMNSLEYFTNLENENSEVLRGDSSENVLAQVYGGKAGKYYIKFMLNVGEGNERKSFDISENTTLSVKLANPSNVMVFCFSALADDQSRRIPVEKNGEWRIDKRFLEFGTHVLLIKNAKEFSSRISRAITDNPNLYNSNNPQGRVPRACPWVNE